MALVVSVKDDQVADSSRPSRRRRVVPEEDPREDSLTPDSTGGNLADPAVKVVTEDEAGEPPEADGASGRADPEDAAIDGEERLDGVATRARKAKSPRPVKRNQTVAPVRKARPTPKREDAHAPARKRTTPVQFVRQSVGELRKVVWPSGATTRQYFFVVLVFVLFIMLIVAGLDALFGWLLLLWLG